MNDIAKMKQNEWLEADGLGGFASGTVSGIRKIGRASCRERVCQYV